MELGLILLAGAVVIAVFVLALTLRRPAAAPEARPDPRLDTVLQSQGDIASRFQQTIEPSSRTCWRRVSTRWTSGSARH